MWNYAEEVQKVQTVQVVQNKRSHFAGGVLTPPLTKGDARPLWKPQNFVPASRGGVYIEWCLDGSCLNENFFGPLWSPYSPNLELFFLKQ
jgi:hypothetical protein